MANDDDRKRGRILRGACPLDEFVEATIADGTRGGLDRRGQRWGSLGVTAAAARGERQRDQHDEIQSA